MKLQQRLAHRILRAIQRRQVEIERARGTFLLLFVQQLLDQIGPTQRGGRCAYWFAPPAPITHRADRVQGDAVGDICTDSGKPSAATCVDLSGNQSTAAGEFVAITRGFLAVEHDFA